MAVIRAKRHQGRVQAVARALGRDTRLPRYLVGQIRRDLQHTEGLTAPAETGEDQMVQDPADGAFYFMPGIDEAGSLFAG